MTNSKQSGVLDILVVDDEVDLAEDLSRFFQELGHKAEAAGSGEEAWDKLLTREFQLVVTDVTLPGMSGVDLVNRAYKKRVPVQFVLISGQEQVIESINAMELGVLDFLSKPVELEDLEALVKKARDESGDYSFYTHATGTVRIFSQKMRNVYRKLRKLQDYPTIPVLIQGETGTGKEVIAKYLHFENPQIEGEFIALNCSSLGRELFDAELFGYEKGAFTGADSKGKPGKLKLAEKGTLFLDEITELTPDLQAKLLRVLQEREYYRVGGTRRQVVDTRIVCATNKNIEQLVKQGAFREDLFFRLTTCKVDIPPLRLRKEEILPLFWSFVREIGDELKKHVEDVEPPVIDRLMDYAWPGNVREMKNLITSLLLFADGPVVTEAMVEPLLLHNHRPEQVLYGLELPEGGLDLNHLLVRIAAKAMERHGGDSRAAAAYLDITEGDLSRLLAITVE